MAQSFGQNSSLPPPLVVEACIPGTKEGVKKQLLTMINSIVFKVKNKGECFIMGSRHQETDKAIARLFSSVSRRLEPVMKHKAGVDPHRFPPFYINRPCRSRSLLRLLMSSVITAKDNFVCYLTEREEIFQTITK